MTRRADFTIETPGGEILTACFGEGGTVALYDEAGRLVHVMPADLDALRTFGKVRAGMLVRARLELERGFSV